jgi:hypothetical protein
MDHQRFDNFARAMASGTSRRRMVKGMVGGAIAAAFGFRDVTSRAQDAGLALGSPCTASSECNQSGGVTTCGDNGIARDGALNCCRTQSGDCAQDSHCCGSLLCTNGTCGGSPSSGSIQVGGTCTATSQCSQAGGATVCGDNGLSRDGALNCCRNLGGPCQIDDHCCGAQLCNSGICGGTQLLPLGSVCTATDQCSQTGGAVVCGDNGLDTDGALNCCRNQGGACTAGSHCCGGLTCTNGVCGGATGALPLGAQCTAASECSQTGGAVVCGDNGISTDGALNCCRNQGGACTADAQCCSSFLCVNGICGGSSSGTLQPGAACTATSQCSQTGGAVVCADNGITTDGALNCCRNQGGACTNGSGCCGSLLCTNGVCGGTTSGTLPPGAACTATSQCSQTGGTTVCASNGITTDGDLNCCRNQGGACVDGTGCCGSLLCTNGICGGTAGGTLPPGAACTATSQCSQTSGVTVCASNGITTDGELNCCRNQGGACADGTGCCGSLLCTNGVCGGTSSGGLAPGAACSATSQCSQVGGATYCANNGLSGDGALNCCRYEGGACTDWAGCCDGLLCTNGVCTSGSSSGSGLAPGASCTATSQCSQVGGPTYCANNGLSGDGALNCCRYEGGACSDWAGCCDGLLCTNGICSNGSSSAGGLAPGGVCTATSQCSQAGGPTYCANNGLSGDGVLNCCRYEGGACTDWAGCCDSLLCTNGICQ